MLLRNIGAKILNKILVTNAKHQKAHIPLSSWVYSRDARILQYMQINHSDTPYEQIEDKNHMIISIDAENGFGKIQHPFMIKALQKNGHRRNLPQHSKDHI